MPMRSTWPRRLPWAKLWLGSAAALTLTLIGFIFFFLAYFASPLWAEGHWQQLLTWRWAPLAGRYGVLAMVTGTLLLAGSALLLAIPLSLSLLLLVGGAAPPRVARALHLLVQLMTSVPTVVWAFLSVFVLVPWVREATGGSGLSWLAAAITLSMLIVPTMVLVPAGQLQQLPPSLALTSASLGLDRQQHLFYVALPAIRASLVVALLLGAGRAIGDTIVALMLSGNAPLVPASPADPLRALTAHIALVLATDSQSLAYASLFVCGLLLCATAVVLNVVLWRLRGSAA